VRIRRSAAHHSLRGRFELRASRQMHLAELPKPDVLNSMLPGLGRDWTEILGALGQVYYRAVSYATEWEVVAARWAADDHTLLQPAEPCWLWPLLYVNNMLKQTVAKKELELCDSPLSRLYKGWWCGMVGARKLTVARWPRAGSALLAAPAPRRVSYTRAAPRNRPPRMGRRSPKTTPVFKRYIPIFLEHGRATARSSVSSTYEL
jgi:hypothetical protein